MINCALNCQFQKDGYCALDETAKINSPENKCPYFLPFADNCDSLLESADTDKF